MFTVVINFYKITDIWSIRKKSNYVDLIIKFIFITIFKWFYFNIKLRMVIIFLSGKNLMFLLFNKDFNRCSYQQNDSIIIKFSFFKSLIFF